jgi:hypothetical protein
VRKLISALAMSVSLLPVSSSGCKWFEGVRPFPLLTPSCEGKWTLYFDPGVSLFITCIIFSSAMPLGETGLRETQYDPTDNSQIRLVHPDAGCSLACQPRRCAPLDPLGTWCGISA